MAQQNVTATRMTLLALKNQTTTAERGHKLLKDKQDGLMQEFLAIIHKAKNLRKEIEEAIKEANKHFLEAQSAMPHAVLQNTLKTPSQEVILKVKTKNVMSVRIPEFQMEITGKPFQYGMLQTRAELDIAILKFSEVFQILMELAEIEKAAENLAIEIEKTRRRVNALEYTLIPELKTTLKYVKMKLAENERSAIVQVMAVKNMIESQEKAAQAALAA